MLSVLFRYLDLRGFTFIPLISTQELKFYEPPTFVFPVMTVFYFGVNRFISCVMLWACCCRTPSSFRRWVFVPAGGRRRRRRRRRCNLPASVMVAEQALMLKLSSGCRAGTDRLREAGTHSEILMTYCGEGLNLPLVNSPSLLSSVSLLLLLPSSSFTSLSLSLSQEGCEIVLCHIKATGALQSEKYDIIRIIRGNLWIRHRSLDQCESGFLEESLFFSRPFISFLSVSLWTYWINLSVFLSFALFFILSLSLSPIPPSSGSAPTHQRPSPKK